MKRQVSPVFFYEVQMKYLNCFENASEFIEYVTEKKINYWCVWDMFTSERCYLIRKSKFASTVNALICLAEERGIVANENEVISWLDTLKQMYIIISHIDYDDIKIIQELKMPLSNKRADYLLIKDNKILIFEFSFENTKNEYQFESKLHQAIGYKEILQGVLPPHIEIATHTFLIKPERNILSQESDDLNSNANFDAQLKAAQFINYFFKNTKTNAFNELEKCYDFLPV